MYEFLTHAGNSGVGSAFPEDAGLAVGPIYKACFHTL